MPTSAKIDHASRSLAQAVAVFIRLIFEGIVLYLLEKGTAVTAKRVSEVGAKLRASKLGVRLAEYVERNWKALVENPKLRRRVEGAASSSGERTRDAGFASSPSHSEAISSVTKNDGQLAGDKKFRLGKQLNPAEVKEFYKQTGWPDAKIDAHMDGIDFSKPVTIEIIPKGTKVDQWVDPIRGVGNYFAPPGTSASELGIYQGERVLTSFETAKDVTVLRSTATDIIDTWSVPGQQIATKGGGTQCFSFNPADFIRL
jgi:filamentous hemagglutinin